MRYLPCLSALALMSAVQPVAAEEMYNAPAQAPMQDGQGTLMRRHEPSPEVVRGDEAPGVNIPPSKLFSNRNHPPATIGPVEGQAIPALPLEVQTSGDITYVTGGIGDEEEAQVKSIARDFNLHVLLSAADGSYISEVKLRLMDAKGQEVLSVNDAGPYFYAHLKPGVYTVEATAPNSEVRKFRVKISASSAASEHVTFHYREE